MENAGRYEEARQRAKAKFGFWVHFAIYAIVILMLFFINVFTSTDYFWFVWPMLGWGVGIAFHALGVFVFKGSQSIIDRMAARELEYLEQDRP